MYNVSDYDFELPKELIARYPAKSRDECRLMVVNVKKHSISHNKFLDLPEFFSKKDLLILNNTRVLKVRLFAKRETGARIEILFIEKTRQGWKVLTNKSKKIKRNEKVKILKKTYNKTELTDKYIHFIKRENEFWIVKTDDDINKIFEDYGIIPIPPYINRNTEPIDETNYQTVYSKIPGSVAAPTAGLHFTEKILNKLKGLGVYIAELTLDVSYGTFNPVKTKDIRDHKMHKEKFLVDKECARIFNKTKLNGNQITAVGTTSLRVIESIKDSDGLIKAIRGETSIYITPPYNNFAVNSLLTNFHTPKSTLLMLVSAFGGYELMMEAYHLAIKEKYRFFSYGDAMLILR